MAKRLKIPKRIAGVKISKSIRKGPIGEFLNSSAGQLLIAEGLLLAGGVLAAKRVDPDSAMGELLHHPGRQFKHVGQRIARGSGRARESMEEASARFSYACSEALRAFRDALNADNETIRENTAASEDYEPGTVVNPEAESAPAAGESVKKKPAASRTETRSTPH